MSTPPSHTHDVAKPTTSCAAVFVFSNTFSTNVSFIKARLQNDTKPLPGTHFFCLAVAYLVFFFFFTVKSYIYQNKDGAQRFLQSQYRRLRKHHLESTWHKSVQTRQMFGNKRAVFRSEGRHPVSCSVTKRCIEWNRFWHRAALALLSRLGDQLRLTLTRASLLSPDPTWHTSFTDASENEPIQAIFSMAAVPAGLISSLDIANAANWSIGVQWRFVLVLRPSLTAVDVQAGRGSLMLKFEVPSGTMRRSFDHCYQVLKKWMSTSSPDLSCLCNLPDSVC